MRPREKIKGWASYWRCCPLSIIQLGPHPFPCPGKIPTRLRTPAKVPLGNTVYLRTKFRFCFHFFDIHFVPSLHTYPCHELLFYLGLLKIQEYFNWVKSYWCKLPRCWISEGTNFGLPDNPQIIPGQKPPILPTTGLDAGLNANVHAFSTCDWHLHPCFAESCSCLEAEQNYHTCHDTTSLSRIL